MGSLNLCQPSSMEQCFELPTCIYETFFLRKDYEIGLILKKTRLCVICFIENYRQLQMIQFTYNKYLWY